LDLCRGFLVALFQKDLGFELVVFCFSVDRALVLRAVCVEFFVDSVENVVQVVYLI